VARKHRREGVTAARAPWANSRYLVGVAGLALMVSLVISSIRIVRMVPEAYELSYGEGLVLWMAQHATEPSLLYHPLERYPFVAGVYPPVFPLAIASLQPLIGDVRLAGRILAAVAFTGMLAAAGALAKDAIPPQYGRYARWSAAFAAAGLAASTSTIASFPPAVRVDGPALCLTLTGLWLFLTSPSSSSRQYVALAVMVLAAFTKQSFISAIAACLLITVVTDHARALRLLLFTVVTALLPLVWLQLSTNGEFLTHVAVYTRSEMSAARLLRFLAPNLLAMLPLLALAVVAVFWRKPSALAFGRDARRRLTNSRWRRCLAGLAVYLLLTFVASWTVGKVGSGEYYFMEWNAAVCILAGAAIGFAIAETGKAQRRRQVLVTLSCAVVILTAGVSAATTANNAFRFTRGARELNAARRVETDQAVRFVRSITAPVVSEDLSLLAVTGRELPFEPFIMWELARQGRWNPSPFIEQLSGRFYGALIFEGDVSKSDLVPESILSAMLANYRHVNGFGRYWVYEPR
jgi:hypothetical protein